MLNQEEIKSKGSLLFNRYEVLSHIGQGGMGHVYKVFDLQADSVLALKTLVPKEGKNLKAIARFKSEFSSMQKLDHPHIVRAFSFHQESEEFLGFSMELVEGEDLDKLIYSEGKTLDLPHKLNVIEQIASGLTFAHDKGLIHRDLKPANILIANSNTINLSAKICDFGLAQTCLDGADMSQSQNQIGTAYYMSPEQHRGEEIDQRSDIYSFGILVYELMTGKRPFDGNTPFKLFLAHVSQEVIEPRKTNPEIPRWLSTMIEICIEKNKNHRYAKMNEVLALIEAKKRRSTNSFFSFNFSK